eukprot:TRINITY_DN8698_c0_g1_i1.p1 TRINITY_DN8698_c0_g1~~TRINITY_DN8698_c0_g1_i1.p1  ORF type:complete len:260 (-),score=42.25 TRINITY_DN8698_c0_g1_i1:185-964(-)
MRTRRTTTWSREFPIKILESQQCGLMKRNASRLELTHAIDNKQVFTEIAVTDIEDLGENDVWKIPSSDCTAIRKCNERIEENSIEITKLKDVISHLKGFRESFELVLPVVTNTLHLYSSSLQEVSGGEVKKFVDNVYRRDETSRYLLASLAKQIANTANEYVKGDRNLNNRIEKILCKSFNRVGKVVNKRIDREHGICSIVKSDYEKVIKIIYDESAPLPSGWSHRDLEGILPLIEAVKHTFVIDDFQPEEEESDEDFM